MALLKNGVRIYDALNYNEGKVLSSTDNEVTYRDDEFNTHIIPTEYAYSINEELTEKYGILICNEHNQLEGEYPYYIPMADENAYEVELEHFSQMYS